MFEVLHHAFKFIKPGTEPLYSPYCLQLNLFNILITLIPHTYSVDLKILESKGWQGTTAIF